MSGKKKPRLLNRFKLVLHSKGPFAHLWMGDRLVVGYRGYQFTFFVDDEHVCVVVFGSHLNYLFKVHDEFDLYARCVRHSLFDVQFLKLMYGSYSRDTERKLRKVGAL